MILAELSVQRGDVEKALNHYESLDVPEAAWNQFQVFFGYIFEVLRFLYACLLINTHSIVASFRCIFTCSLIKLQPMEVVSYYFLKKQSIL